MEIQRELSGGCGAPLGTVCLQQVLGWLWGSRSGSEKVLKGLWGSVGGDGGYRDTG